MRLFIFALGLLVSQLHAQDSDYPEKRYDFYDRLDAYVLHCEKMLPDPEALDQSAIESDRDKQLFYSGSLQAVRSLQLDYIRYVSHK